MKALVTNLSRHQTTRKLGKALAAEYEDEGQRDNQLDEEQRQGLEWQRCLVEALLRYTDTMCAAFDELAQAHEALIVAGIEEVENAAPLVQALSTGTREARSFILGIVKKDRGPLEWTQRMLQKYAEDVQEADRAAAEFQRYNQKLEGLVADVDGDQRERRNSNPKIDPKFTRNKDKLDSAGKAARDAHVQAVDALRSATQRHDPLLCEIATRLVSGGTAAFRVVTGAATDVMLECPVSSDPADDLPKAKTNPQELPHVSAQNETHISGDQASVPPPSRHGSVKNTPVAAEIASEGYNPFADGSEKGASSEACSHSVGGSKGAVS